jgi:acyl-CoA synthetase (NDP forming)
VFAVNPKYREVSGRPCFPSLADLPERPDVVVVQVSTSRVFSVVEEAIGLGIRGFVVPGGGYTDSADDATALEAGLRHLARHTPIQVVGPNCMGVVDLVSGAAPYVGTVPAHVRRGSVAAISHSGAVIEALVNSGGRVPLSTVVSTGSEAVTTMTDYLRFFAVDGETEGVLAFVEGFDDPSGFVAAARELARVGKPFAVCMVGRSAVAQAGISAHSGKLAPPFEVAAAALEQAGAVVATELDELVAFGEIFGSGRRPIGRRMHVVANSGGEANMIADLASDAGLELPAMSRASVESLKAEWPKFHVANPLDPWGAGDYQQIYPAAIAAAAAEPGDILMVSIDQQQWSGEFEKQLGRDLATYLESCVGDKLPVFVSPTSQDPDAHLAQLCHDGAIPLLRGARTACSALGKLARARMVEPVARVDTAPTHPMLERGRPLSEAEALEVLDAFGVEVPRRVVVDTAEEAGAAAEQLAGAVVVKGLSAGLHHKSEHNLVELGLVGERQTIRAAQRIQAAAGWAGVEVRYLVMEQIEGVLDVYVGYRHDPQFGPTFLVGLGGVWTEFYSDVEIHVGDLDEPTARSVVDRSTVGRMMREARGGALFDEGVVQALVVLGDLVAGCPLIQAIDVNPLIVSRTRAVAVDAVIETVPLREEALT